MNNIEITDLNPEVALLEVQQNSEKYLDYSLKFAELVKNPKYSDGFCNICDQYLGA